MEDVYEAIKDSTEMKKDGEALETVIRNTKRSAANRAILAHKLDTEFDPQPSI